MTDYISREAALKALFAPGMCYAPMQLQIIKDLPAADVAEVVPCKDCKHYRNHPDGLCYLHAVCVEPDDFCSYGEYQTNTGGSNNVAD